MLVHHTLLRRAPSARRTLDDRTATLIAEGPRSILPRETPRAGPALWSSFSYALAAVDNEREVLLSARALRSLVVGVPTVARLSLEGAGSLTWRLLGLLERTLVARCIFCSARKHY